jgi:dTDP-4-dehydrorhamnose reductase
MSSKTLLIGGRGTLGADVSRIFAELGYPLAGPGREALDVRDPAQVLRAIEEFQPARVIHLAALTDVDACQRDPEAAFRTNTLGAQNVALACQRHGLELLYISTLAVFNGHKPEAYTEFDAPDPANIYGRSKFEGEQMVRALVPRHYVVRAGWIFGGGPHDKKFVGKILAQARERTELQAVDDKFGSPTYTVDFARGLARLAESGLYGTYHLVNTGQPASRFEVAQHIVQAAGLSHCQVLPVSSSTFPLAAPRPRMEAARNYQLELRGLHWMRPWTEALEEYAHSLG